MARVPSKHGRDQPLVGQDLEGFLNNLEDWEHTVKDKDKKLKSQTRGKEKLVSSSQNMGVGGEDRRSMRKSTSMDNSSTARQYDHLRNYDAISQLASGLMTEESTIDANSEKELGNECFKQKKFQEAIDCYSRSIALSPTAVAYANRAMAYLKIRRYQEAEDDCTEALNLDDRYIKAYSRRSTARKELGKLKESIEDAEFALRLEPGNQEIKKQYTEAKSLLDKEILKKAQKIGKSNLDPNQHVQGIQSVSNGSQRTRVTEIQDDRTKDNVGHDVDASHKDENQNTSLQSYKRSHRSGKQELGSSVQELAARAASLAMVEAAKNITPPNSAYHFEVSWRGLSSDRALQARLLKTTSPTALPQIFKNALSAPLLIDVIRCIATFFTEEMDLAVKYLENFTKVPRFDMIIMCLSSMDKADLLKIWDEVFCKKGTPECMEMLGKLRSRYCLKQ